MTKTIAISGKGGSGKTTLAAAIVRTLIEHAAKPVLAVDADPNSCLGLTLGVEPQITIAEIREQTRTKQPAGSSMDRIRSFEYGIQQAVTEAKNFDLLTMGRPEGPACYCAANNLLRQFLDKLSSSYRFVVMDNEAGMEHLSRRTTNNVDLLCIIAEPTPLGTLTARRIFNLAGHLPISVKKIGVIWNKAQNNNKLDEIETIGCIPYDQALFDSSTQNKSIFEIAPNSTAVEAVENIVMQHIMEKM
ncbi:MAG: AAA family ATPase [Planctomycetota bacterium]